MLLASTLFSYREESCEAVKDDVKGPACRNVNCCLGVVEKDGVTFASGIVQENDLVSLFCLRHLITVLP
ncbi:unnamed protein product [Linum trigynum]|uniref:Uncharacterized protein n=1 Tax=Linum trigynum TaxID=586398 RepID=A0AAV2GM46_9ROSI